MTNKQTTTLILFAKNYTFQVIAKKQKVSLSTVRERIKSLSKNHSREFDNALALRKACKRNKKALRNPLTINNDETFDGFEHWGKIKMWF